MIIVPVESADHKNDMLLIVLDQGNIDRMKMADPAEVELQKVGKTLVNPMTLLCYERDTPELSRLMQSVSAGDESGLKKLIKFLQRGWKYRPDKGDHDRGPERLAEGN